MGEFRPHLAERFVGEPALRDVADSGDVFERIVIVPDRVSDNLQEFHRSIGHQQRVFAFEVAAGAPLPSEGFVKRRQVFRMNAHAHQIEDDGDMPVELTRWAWARNASLRLRAASLWARSMAMPAMWVRRSMSP